MKKLLSICIISIYCTVSYAFIPPYVNFYFPSSPPSTVFYGETLRIPLIMHFANLQGNKVWDVLVAGSSLEEVGGVCPVPWDSGVYILGDCSMNIVVPGDRLGKVISGYYRYLPFGSKGHDPNKKRWDKPFYTPSFYVTVIPHPLSMSTIATQEATANTNFTFNLKSVVRYYEENATAGTPAQAIVTPSEQYGLRFDPTNFSIIGKPKRTGRFFFQVGAKNAYSTAAPTELKIDVAINPKDTPKFKPNAQMVGAMAGTKYSMNLMNLLEHQPGFMESNQIAFRIDSNKPHPDWLDITYDDATRIEGIAPSESAGQEIELTLIASSNTGGDSESLKIQLPIFHDIAKRPSISFFRLEQTAGGQISEDLLTHIKNPAQDSNIKIILDKVEPSAPWLHVSSLYPTRLEGTVPTKSIGQLYKITLRASSSIGGSSESITIPLQISIDPRQTPQFRDDNPILPMLYCGQSYFYDFIENNDVSPAYHDAPYEIKFAEGFEHPNWLRIENNQLIADNVPEDISSDLNIHLIITNTPGGASKVISLMLTAMN